MGRERLQSKEGNQERDVTEANEEVLSGSRVVRRVKVSTVK